MAKYIDREALVEWLKSIPLIDLSDGRGLCRVIMEDDFKKAIKKMPKGIIADVAPVRHGHWNTINQIATGLSWKYRCNDCGCPQEYTHNYCPNCGARMDGGAYNDCPYRTEPMKNADRIRSMSDEELAAKISHQTISSVCDIVCGRDCKAFATLDKTSQQQCVEIVLDWLQQPCEGGE